MLVVVVVVVVVNVVVVVVGGLHSIVPVQFVFHVNVKVLPAPLSCAAIVVVC